VQVRRVRQSLHLAFFMLAFMAIGVSCTRKAEDDRGGRLRVVTTIFPIYDFVRAVGGDAIDVQLLLPPGVESHSFEPRPEEVIRVGRSDLFIYTNAEMEPWGAKLLASVQGTGAPLPLEAGAGARYLAAASRPDGGGDGHHHESAAGRDPHIWLNIANAGIMVDNIAAGLASKAPASRELFMANAAAYKKRLDGLESSFRSGLADCRTREFIHGGHYAFAYLAESHNLTYLSAYGITADSEPSPRRMMDLVRKVREHRLKAIFFEELLAPGVAQTVANETGAELLKLHGIHNVTRQELESGVTYVGLMEQNLASLRKGLECR